MASVFVVISAKGFILGVYTNRPAAELVITNNPQHLGCRISEEPVLAH